MMTFLYCNLPPIIFWRKSIFDRCNIHFSIPQKVKTFAAMQRNVGVHFYFILQNSQGRKEILFLLFFYEIQELFKEIF